MRRIFKNLLCSALAISAILICPLQAESKSQKSLVELIREANNYIEEYVVNGSMSAITLPYIQIRRRGSFVKTECISDAYHTALYGSHYCGANKEIVLEKEQLSAFRSKFGDAAVKYIVFHEYAHHIQRLKGTRLKQPHHELQADCYAGALMFDSPYSAKKIGLNKDSFLEVVSAAYSAGGSHSHGSREDRAKAMTYGAENGMYGCDKLMGTSTAYNKKLPGEFFQFDDKLVGKVVAYRAVDSKRIDLYEVDGNSNNKNSVILIKCSLDRYVWHKTGETKTGNVNEIPGIMKVYKDMCGEYVPLVRH